MDKIIQQLARKISFALIKGDYALADQLAESLAIIQEQD
jgi:hypothetical protein